MNAARPVAHGNTLIVLLPGATMRAADFAKSGLMALATQYQPAVEVLPADFAMEITPLDQAITRLYQDYLAPRRAAYDRIWLAGISLGGLLALGLAASHPALVDGLCLLAPYPGSRLTTQAIDRAGGLADWQITPAEQHDPEFCIWHWLKQPPATLPVFIGYGQADRFAERIQTVADCFPAHCCHRVAGTHDWPAWTPLWQTFLQGLDNY